MWHSSILLKYVVILVLLVMMIGFDQVKMDAEVCIKI